MLQSGKISSSPHELRSFVPICFKRSNKLLLCNSLRFDKALKFENFNKISIIQGRVGSSLSTYNILNNITCSVRVSNELGANHPKTAKFSVVVAVVTSTLFGIFFLVAILASRSYFPRLFSDKQEVIKETSRLGYFLAATIFLNSILPVLHGKLCYILI